LGVNGISILIDGSFNGFHEVRDMLKLHRIPYFNFDFSLQSLVKMLERYLVLKGTGDAVFIFQDEISTEEALHTLSSKSSVRFMLLDKLTPDIAKRLSTLRPTPKFFSIISDGTNMERLFQNVRFNPHHEARGKVLSAFRQAKIKLIKLFNNKNLQISFR
jgi:hypothetical protein